MRFAKCSERDYSSYEFSFTRTLSSEFKLTAIPIQQLLYHIIQDCESSGSKVVGPEHVQAVLERHPNPEPLTGIFEGPLSVPET